MKTNTYKFAIILFLLGGINLTAQNNVGINTESPDPTAILDIHSEDKGLLIPRLTTAQRENISAPAHSLMVFDVDTQMLTYYDALESEWVFVPKKSEIYWVKSNNHIHNVNPQNVGIGTTNPRTDLHIKGRPGQESGLTITNGDSTYSIIIVIDNTDDGIIVKGEDGIDNKLKFQQLRNGKFGIGTKPSSLLHLKPNDGVEPIIQISNEDSTYNIIIVIDNTDDGIIVKGHDTENERILYSADKIGRFGVGLNNPRNILHLKSDTLNPNVRLTSPSYDHDYVMGFDSNSSAFIIKRMFNIGGSEDVFVEVDPDGDLYFNSVNNNVNISPGITTSEIEFNNPLGDNPTITVDANGNLDFGQTVGSPNALLTLNFNAATLSGNGFSSRVELEVDNNLMPNTPSAYSFTQNNSLITINETGYYVVSYALSIGHNHSSSTELSRYLLDENNNILPNTEFEDDLRSASGSYFRPSTFYFFQIMYFTQGSQFKIGVQKNNGPSTVQIYDRTTLSIQKVAN